MVQSARSVTPRARRIRSAESRVSVESHATRLLTEARETLAKRDSELELAREEGKRLATAHGALDRELRSVTIRLVSAEERLSRESRRKDELDALRIENDLLRRSMAKLEQTIERIERANALRELNTPHNRPEPDRSVVKKRRSAPKANRGRTRKVQQQQEEQQQPGPSSNAPPVQRASDVGAEASPSGGSKDECERVQPEEYVVLDNPVEKHEVDLPGDGATTGKEAPSNPVNLSEHMPVPAQSASPTTPGVKGTTPLEELQHLADLTRQIHMAKTEAIQFTSQGNRQLAADVKYLLSLLQRAKSDHEEQNSSLTTLRRDLHAAKRELTQTKKARKQDRESFSRTVRAEREILERRLRKSEEVAERRKIMIRNLMEWIESRHEQFTIMNQDLHEQLVDEKAKSATVLEQLVEELHADLEEVDKLELPEERKPVAHRSPQKGVEIEVQTESVFGELQPQSNAAAVEDISIHDPEHALGAETPQGDANVGLPILRLSVNNAAETAEEHGAQVQESPSVLSVFAKELMSSMQEVV